MKILWRRVLVALLVYVVLFSAVPVFGGGSAFLWEIKSDSGSSYLLGSVHVLKKEHYPLKKVIEDAYTNTDVLVVEADLSSSKAAAASMKMLQKGMYTDGKTIEDHVSKATFDMLQKKLKELKLDYGSLKTFKPWMLAMVLLMNQLTKMGFDPTVGVDMHFLKKATADKKEIIELEGVEFQLKLFDGFTKEEAEQFLLTTIKEADQISKEFDKIITSWMTGDVEAMEHLLTDYAKESPAAQKLFKKINDDRNVGMADKIANYLKSGKRYFVVVGAAHMVGPKGVVQLLRNKGFTVNQL
jgi:uncharacterized protein YbaP (TraB family)